jgi:hypothetical protein
MGIGQIVNPGECGTEESPPDNYREIKLPGEFTGEQLVEAFRNAATFQESDSRKWEVVVFRRWAGQSSFSATAVPADRIRPNVIQRRLFGKRDTWKSRAEHDSTCVRIDMSDVNGRGLSGGLFGTATHDRVGLSIHAPIDEVEKRWTTHPDHPAFAQYREAYDRIVRVFLEQLSKIAAQ